MRRTSEEVLYNLWSGFSGFGPDLTEVRIFKYEERTRLDMFGLVWSNLQVETEKYAIPNHSLFMM